MCPSLSASRSGFARRVNAYIGAGPAVIEHAGAAVCICARARARPALVCKRRVCKRRVVVAAVRRGPWREARSC
eukprot:3620340-Lingulodinium_polyedra.AAC.1